VLRPPGRLALQVWALLFVLYFGADTTAANPAFRVLAQALFGLPLLVWAVLRLRGPGDALDGAILVALVAHVVVALLGEDVIGGLASSALAIGYAALFWMMRDLAGQPRLRQTIALPAAMGLILWAAAAAVAWVAEKVAWIGSGGGLPELESYQVFIWATANVFPFLVLLAAGLVGWLRAGLGRRALWWMLALSGLVVVPFSNGRAGWLAIGAALVAWELLRGGSAVRQLATRVRPRFGQRAVVAAVAVVVLGVLALAVRFGPAVVAGLDLRLRVWSQAIGIFADDPLTGGGPSTYAWLRLVHVPDYHDRVGVVLAHDVPLQTLADGGLLLTLAFGAVAALWLRQVASRTDLSGAALWSAAVVIGFGVGMLLDDFSGLPAVPAIAIALAAWAIGPAAAAPSPARRWPLPIVVGLLFAVSAPAVVSTDAARLSAASAREAALAGDWSMAAEQFDRAVEWYPDQALYRLGLGQSLAHVGDAEAAREQYRAARELSPGDPRSYAALGMLTSDLDERVDLLDAASRRSVDPEYAVRFAQALADVDRDDEAVRSYAHAVTLRPDLYANLVLDEPAVSHEAVRAALPDALKAVGPIAGRQTDDVTWDVGLFEGELPSDAHPAWRAVAAADAGDFESARHHADAARWHAPHQAQTFQAAAAVALAACDEAAYRQALALEALTAGRFRAAPDPVRLQRDLYRDIGLGSHQPPGGEQLPALSRWPLDLVPELKSADCGWEADR